MVGTFLRIGRVPSSMESQSRAENRNEAIRGVVGCVAAAAGGAAGMLAWAPYGRHGIFGGFEGTSEWNVLWFGLPVMTLGGVAAGITLFALARRKWRQALGAAVVLAALAGFGVVFDVLEGPPLSCGPGC
ncbi:hypothetical protein [Streptomyces sp. sk2.1]|uniref:hypothetical protein n=1 Tax=Streptomyces sp. sk2.1 TaxID=2478959 RepID=UPI0021CD1446|nr:hypothetical protein [Streptomyces sp. sk2.1]